MISYSWGGDAPYIRKARQVLQQELYTRKFSISYRDLTEDGNGVAGTPTPVTSSTRQPLTSKEHLDLHSLNSPSSVEVMFLRPLQRTLNAATVTHELPSEWVGGIGGKPSLAPSAQAI